MAQYGGFSVFHFLDHIIVEKMHHFKNQRATDYISVKWMQGGQDNFSWRIWHYGTVSDTVLKNEGGTI